MCTLICPFGGLHWWLSDIKNPPAHAGDAGSIPGSGSSYEKEMTTNSIILAWRIPWTEEPGRLQSMGSQRVGHGWTTKHKIGVGTPVSSFRTLKGGVTWHLLESVVGCLHLARDIFCVHWSYCWQVFSGFWLFATPWTVLQRIKTSTCASCAYMA